MPKKKVLPMNWYNFFIWVILPVSIIINLYNVALVGSDLYNNFQEFNFSPTYEYILLCFNDQCISIILAILCVFSIYTLVKKMKISLYILFSTMITSTIANATYYSINLDYSYYEMWFMFIIFIVVVSLIYILPNYVYFKKRKNIFINDNNFRFRNKATKRSEKLKELKDLFDKELITQKDYNLKKKEILEDL